MRVPSQRQAGPGLRPLARPPATAPPQGLPPAAATATKSQRPYSARAAGRALSGSFRCCSSANGNGSQSDVCVLLHTGPSPWTRPIVLTSRAPIQNVVIIGSGPAGYTAAIYAGRANLRPLIFEGVSAGGSRGGQLMTTNEVENFPGFPEGITGPDLMDRMRAQAERWGTVLRTEDVIKVDLSSRPYTVTTDECSVQTNSIILATGATAQRLGLPSESEFWSRGISACAICDGASPLFKGREVAVVGGGDSATEEAHYITKYTRHVHLLVRGPKMRASKTMQQRVIRNPKITVHYNTGVIDAYGDAGGLKGLHLLNRETKAEWDLPVHGLFYGIGHKPNSSLFSGAVQVNEKGYVVVGTDGTSTSVEGVFSAGDLHDMEWRQAVTAAGSGCMAAISAERYLVASNLIQELSATADEVMTVSASERESESDVEEDELEEDFEKNFDISKTSHRGQYALRKLYHETDRLLVVLYTSPGCGPCRTLKPMVNGVVDEFGDRVHYVQIDIEKDPEIAEAAGVMGTPTLQCFKDKERVESIQGVKMKSEWRKIFTKYTATEAATEKVPVESS